MERRMLSALFNTHGRKQKAERRLIQISYVEQTPERQCVESEDVWGFRTSKRHGDIHFCLLVSHIFHFIFWLFLFIPHLFFCLLCFNLCNALTTARLWFVIPSEFPLVPLVSSNTYFFLFFCMCEIFPVHTGKQRASRKTAAFKQRVNHLFATSWRTHRKNHQPAKISDTYHLSKTFFSGT